MSQTPNTTDTPYCTATQLLVWCDWRAVADYAADPEDPDDERPAKADLTNSASDAGAVVLAHLLAASGELETACLAGKRYTPADLQALVATTAGGRYLQRLVANLTTWSLMQRRHPETADPEKVPAAKQVMAVLEQLRKGERIMPFDESAEAGGAATASLNYDQLTQPGGGRTVAAASRVFDTRETIGS